MLKKLCNISYIIAIVVIILDKLTKMYALAHFKLGVAKPVFSWLNYTLLYNKGIAFSLFNDGLIWQRWLLIGITVGVICSLIIWIYSQKNKHTLYAMGLILGGALGNLWDRINYGMVIDFIDVHYKHWHWPVFNIADAAICVGAVWILIKLRRI
ncbi:MAG: signal peptidase II [Legionellales bacterium]|nr:MAG: signal peptidase II [Legionellales bacterium]